MNGLFREEEPAAVSRLTDFFVFDGDGIEDCFFVLDGDASTVDDCFFAFAFDGVAVAGLELEVVSTVDTPVQSVVLT